MSSSDRRLLSIMRLFEAEKRTSLSPFFSRWSPTPDATVSDALEVVQNFDPVYMLRTCLAFPLWRRFGEERVTRDGSADDSMYDPLMVIVLSAQMLVECPPTTPLGWVKVFRSNVVSLLIRCLSSKDPNIRETALCQVASLWESVQVSFNNDNSDRWFVDSFEHFMAEICHARSASSRLCVPSTQKCDRSTCKCERPTTTTPDVYNAHLVARTSWHLFPIELHLPAYRAFPTPAPRTRCVRRTNVVRHALQQLRRLEEGARVDVEDIGRWYGEHGRLEGTEAATYVGFGG